MAAATITLSETLTLVGTSATTTVQVSQSITQTDGVPNTCADQVIGTTTESITFGDVTSPGYMAIKNTDATNFVLIGLSTPVTALNAVAHLKAGEGMLIPTRQATWYALADTASVTISKQILSL